MNLKKRGQVTAFVFLGILIFMVFAVTIYGVGQIAKVKLQEAAENQINDILYSQNVENYVDRCVRDATKDALVLIGKQGGYIYKEQGTSLKTNPPKEEIKINEVKQNYTYLLYLDEEQTTIPNYPCKDYPTYGCGINLEGLPYCRFIYGSSKDKFCVFESEILPELEIIELNDQTSELERDLFLEEELESVTIKKELEEYITNRTHYCVNFTNLQKTFPLFEIEAGDISTEVTIGKEQVSVVVDYPININFFGRAIKTKSVEFDTIEKNRLGQIVLFLNQVLLRKEIRDLEYDINIDGQREFENYFGNEGSLTLEFEKDVLPGVDLIKIKDSLYTLYNSDYVFRFLRGNANPALDYIPDYGAQGTNYDIITIATKNDEAQKLLLSPVARDINEDNLIYKYYGWMAEFTQKYNINAEDIISCVLNSNLIDCSSDKYFSEYFNTLQTDNLVENKWESSEEYNITKQEASIILNRERDLGPHNVTIVVNDEHGFVDWQIIRIFVDRELKAIFDPCNIYDYINPESTTFECKDGSIEDPYVLDASRSIGSLLGTTFSWTDSFEDWSTDKRGDVSYYCSLLPGFLQCGIDAEETSKEYDILTMTNEENNFYEYSNSDHDVTLSLIAYGQSDSTTNPIRVHQCLPFESANPIYPYNNEGTNPFFADHTCCGNNFNLLGTNTECYNEVAYSWYNGFDNFVEELNIALEGYTHQTSENYVALTASNQNNIFKMEMSRKCDGTRGNICAGDITFTKTSYEECNYNSTLLEQCSGPDENLKTNVFTIGQNTQDTYCVNYEDTTFEEIFLEGGGICDDTPSCDGDLLINSWTCDGGGGCTKKSDWEDCNNYDGYDGEYGDVVWKDYSCLEETGTGIGLDSEVVPICGVDNNISLDTNKELCLGSNYGLNWVQESCCGDDENEFKRQTISPTNVGCCAETQCWNGESCVSDETLFSFSGKQYVCNGESGYWEENIIQT